MITQIDYNFRQVGISQSREGYAVDTYKVGVGGVVSIKNISLMDCDTYSGPSIFEVEFTNGDYINIYNANLVYHSPKTIAEKP
jgi:hypothetical protein